MDDFQKLLQKLQMREYAGARQESYKSYIEKFFKFSDEASANGYTNVLALMLGYTLLEDLTPLEQHGIIMQVNKLCQISIEHPTDDTMRCGIALVTVYEKPIDFVKLMGKRADWMKMVGNTKQMRMELWARENST